MKAFIAALAVFALTLGACIASDICCHRSCEMIEGAVVGEGAEGAAKALSEFKSKEWLFKLSVDNGYVTEARVSLESLIAAYKCEDSYETVGYIRDTALRVERVRRSLFI